MTPDADTDVARALRQTRRQFGRGQVAIYAELIDRGVAMAAENPSRPSCVERNDIRQGAKSFHLELVTRRRHSASLLLYFIEMKAPDGEGEVVIIGMVHEHMEPKRKISRVLRQLDREVAAAATPVKGPK